MRLATTLLASAAIFASAPAFAQDAAPAADAEAGPTEIVVFGSGQTRQVQELRAADLAILASGTSPLKAIEKLPSVNFQSADPFGNYEWSTRLTIRGFNQNQLGFTLDGIPLGDMTYGNHNGLHVSRAISPENIAVTQVSQGSGSITTQSTNNLGGTLEFSSIDPAALLGSNSYAADASGTYGSEQTFRGFGRVAVGSSTGARLLASVQYHKADKWKGDGEQRTFMTNVKAIVPVGAVNFDGWFGYSNRAEQDYQDLSLEQINRLGYDWDNFGPSKYVTAVAVADIGANRGDTGVTPTNAAAGTTYPAPITSADDAYYDASGLRKDWVWALGASGAVTDSVKFAIKGYYHHNRGEGTWGTPYVASPSGVPMAARTTEYDINRKGVFGSLTAELGMHKLTVGGWYENNDFEQARRYYGYTSRTNPGLDHLKFLETQTNALATDWDVQFNTKTYQYYVQDEIVLGDASINFGWKGFQVDNSANAIKLGSRAEGKLQARDWFQPHVGVNYKVMPGTELFAGFTQVTRAFAVDATSSPFSTKQSAFDAIKDTLKPEASDTYEAGLRFHDGAFSGVLGGYYVNFRNRLLIIPTALGIIGAANVVQNVGKVRAYGLEAAGEYKLPMGFGLFASYSYNNSTYRDDVTVAGVGVVPTSGKTVVDTPKHLLRGELSYDSTSLYGRVGVNYMSKRYFTYLNDQSVPGRAIVDATIGYKLDIGQRVPVELQVNGTNLFDKRYVASIGSNGFGFSGDSQTLLAGSPRQVFVTLKAGF
jgi:iron complex outermembrane receptor protein